MTALNISNRLLASIGLALILLPFGPAALAQTFTVQGRMKSVEHRQTPPDEFRCYFTIDVSGTYYHIRYVMPQKNGITVIRETGSEGSDSYSQLLDARGIGAPDGSVSGPFPAESSNFTQLAWLAYASSSYFDKRGSDVLIPMVGFAFNGNFYVDLKSEAIRYPEEPRLPQSITWRAATKMKGTANNVVGPASPEFPPAVKSVRWDANNDEWICGRYSVTKTTNFQSMTLPIELGLERYTVDFGRTNQIKLRTYTSATVTNIFYRVRENYLPELTQTRTTRVSDRRFYEELNQEIYYEVSNRWLAADHPIVQRQVERARRQVGIPEKLAGSTSPSRVNPVVVVVFGTVLMFLLAIRFTRLWSVGKVLR